MNKLLEEKLEEIKVTFIKDCYEAKNKRVQVYNVDKDGVLRSFSKGKLFIEIGIDDIAVRRAFIFFSHFLAIKNNAGEFRVLKDITGAFNRKVVYSPSMHKG